MRGSKKILLAMSLPICWESLFLCMILFTLACSDKTETLRFNAIALQVISIPVILIRTKFMEIFFNGVRSVPQFRGARNLP